MGIASSYKWAAILGVMLITFLYSYVQRQKYAPLYTQEAKSQVLKELPSFEAINFLTKDKINENSFNNTLVVHFWGTWCAPCEEEFPEIVDLAKRFKGKDITFLFMAVNDKASDVKKFLSKYKNLPKHIVMGHDEFGKTLDQFGTVKVPETYVFLSNKKAFKKFIGPQKWRNNYYFSTLDTLLSTKK